MLPFYFLQLLNSFQNVKDILIPCLYYSVHTLHINAWAFIDIGQFAGRYIHLSNVTRDIRKTLPDVLQGISERPSSKTLECSGSLRDWPNGRGVFYSKDRSLCAWTNREDHLRIMFRDTGLDIAEAFQK